MTEPPDKRIAPQEPGAPLRSSEAAEPDELVARHTRLVPRAILVSGLTLVSRLVGFLREILAAALFGDRSGIFDAFITAWRVPNLFRRFLGEGALSTSLQTVVTRADGEEGLEAGRAVFLATLRTTLWLLLVLCGAVMLGVAYLPDTMPVTGWPWLGADPGPVRELTVRVMPYVVLICITALCMGALNVRGHFATPAVAPVMMNLVWVGTLVVIGARWGWPGAGGAAPDDVQLEMTRFLAWGVLVAGVAQLVVLVPALRSQGLLGRTRVAARPGAAWEVLKRSAPLALGAAVYQVNVMVDGLMAEELLRDGGPTAHYYANRVQQFPMALISIAATASVFPALQALGLRRRLAELRSLHDRTQLAVVFLALPAGVGLFVLAGPLASVLFERGAFGADGTARVTAALEMLSLALLPAGAAGLLGRTYYALGDFRTPVRVSIAMLAVNAALNVVFVVWAGMDVEGLALATAVSSWGNVALLLPGLRGRLSLPGGERGVARRVLWIALASAASGAAAWGAHAGAARVFAPPGGYDRSALALVAGITAGIMVFALAAELLRIEEWQPVKARLGRRRRPPEGPPGGSEQG